MRNKVAKRLRREVRNQNPNMIEKVFNVREHLKIPVSLSDDCLRKRYKLSKRLFKMQKSL